MDAFYYHRCQEPDVAQQHTEHLSREMIEVDAARRFVYDGVLEAQFIMVHDANKQLLGVADIYPGAQLVAELPVKCSSWNHLIACWQLEEASTGPLKRDTSTAHGSQEFERNDSCLDAPQAQSRVAVAAAEAIEAKKGDLTIRAMLRHDDPALLEKLRHQPLVRLLRLQGFRLGHMSLTCRLTQSEPCVALHELFSMTPLPWK